MKRLATLFVILAVGACSSTPTPGAGELRVIPISGEVKLLDGGDTSILDEATTVQAGLDLQTGPDGRAEVLFPGGSSVELGPGALLQLDDLEPEVSKGSVLVRAGGDISLHAGAAHIEATDSTFRIDRQTSVVLGVYSGIASIPGAGVDVPALRQATVLQNGSTPGTYQPLRVNPNDTWDIQFLGQAIDVGVQLLSLERGLTRQLPPGEEARAVSAALDSNFSTAAIRAAIHDLGDAAQAVVAAVVAREVVRIDGGSYARVFSEVVSLQALADNWIVIVAQWGLEEASERLLDQLGDLAVVIAGSVAPPEAPSSSASTSASGGPSQEGSIERDPGGTGSGGPGPENKPPEQPGSGDAPPPEPPDENPGGEPPVQSCGDDVQCAVEDIIPDRISISI